ncbi:MAG: energy transducer TonB [Bacteroidota bacterium]
MIPKKTRRANLERRRGTNFIIGMIVSLSLILISFEWTRTIDVREELVATTEIEFEEEMIRIKRKAEPKQKVKLPPIQKVIDIVPDYVEEDIFDPDWEVTDETRVDIYIPDDPVEDISDDIPFRIVEEMPTFNGGHANEFARYLAQNVKYPEIAAENGVSGRVYVEFDIDKKGNLVNPVVIRGVDPALDAEALRVLKSSPRWTPGKQRGKAVTVRFTSYINFVLQ